MSSRFLAVCRGDTLQIVLLPITSATCARSPKNPTLQHPDRETASIGSRVSKTMQSLYSSGCRAVVLFSQFRDELENRTIVIR